MTITCLGGGILDVLGGGAAEHALGQRDDHLAGVDHGLHVDAAVGAAVLLGDDAVLRHVDQAARQIAGVGRLQRRVGETLARAVRRVEVLEHRQALLEVGDDRRLDDLARRLGHEAAHAGELAHLLLRAARSGVRHHVDRVDLLGAAGRLVDLHRGDAVHHLLGDLVGALRPGVDHLVVLLELGDEAVVVLLLVLAHELVGLLDELGLRVRDHHVVLAERDAGLEGVVEAQPHDAVAEDHRLLLTAVAVDGIDQAGDGLLGQQLVDERELDARLLRQQLAEQQPARRGVVHLDHLVAVVVDGV